MRAMIPLDPSSPLLVTVSSGISSSLLLAGVGVTEIMYLEILENREELEIGVLLPASSVLSLDDVDLLDSDDLGGVGEVLGLPNPLNLGAVEEAILEAADLGSRGRRERGGKLSPGHGEIGGGVILERVPQPEESEDWMVMSALCLLSFNT